MDKVEVIGIDVGAGTTKLARVGIDGMLKSQIIYIDTERDPNEFMNKLKGAIKQIMISEVKAIGLGIPSWNGELEAIYHSPNMPSYEGLKMKKILQEHFSELLVVADNDANVAADGERRFGGWPEGTLVVFTLGTGIGGGVILYVKEFNRYIKWQGDRYRGAELGHISIPLPEGRQSRFCGCGNVDCLEAHASATAVRDEATKMVLSALTQGRRSLILDKIAQDERIRPKLVTSEPLELVKYIEPLHVNLAARDGDEIAIKLEDQTAQALAFGLRNVTQIFDPSIVVLAGAMKDWTEMVEKSRLIYERLLGVVPPVSIGISRLSNAGIFGSAAMAFDAIER